MVKRTLRHLAVALLVVVALPAMTTGAQIAAAAQPSEIQTSTAQRLIIEEVQIYGTKRSATQAVQDVPAQVSAFGEAQLEARTIVTLEDMSFSVPNVTLDGIGTVPGIANFAIRGFGINSSVPSIDPAVGVFVDGVYLGTTYATIIDTFDLESVEIFRGPQGVLFGRNVTGGAVLMRTARPNLEDDLRIKAKLGYETEDKLTTALSVAGPLIDGKLAGKLTFYRSDDSGYFENKTLDKNTGATETNFVRGVVVAEPADNMALIAILEMGETKGDGAVPQAPEGALPTNPSSKVITNSDHPGSSDQEWSRLTLEFNWDIGEGRLTNIFGWREVDVTGDSDIDGSPIANFVSSLSLDQEQFSNELRYNVLLNDNWDVIAGVYYFEQEVRATNGRVTRSPTAERIADPFDVMGTTTQVRSLGGGQVDHSTWGVFLSNDYDLTDTITLTAGIRYTEETKENVKIYPRALGACNVDTGACPTDQVPRKDDWSSVIPKLGMQWTLAEDAQVYGHWTRGFRSGGFNLRSAVENPPAYDQETQDSYEVGLKSTFADGRIRFNGALFYNEIEDLQRTTLIVVDSDLRQDIGNAADAVIKGAEIELSFLLTDNAGLNIGVGYLDGEYSSVKSDLTSDGVVDSADKDLKLARLPELSYNIEVTYDFALGDAGSLASRLAYSFRDETFYDDRNRGVLPKYSMVDAGLIYMPANADWTVSIYGKNLTDEAVFGAVIPIGTSFAPGDSSQYFAPLQKGRRYGVEVKYDF
jgi:iron complex outermembrane recepter protein